MLEHPEHKNSHHPSYIDGGVEEMRQYLNDHGRSLSSVHVAGCGLTPDCAMEFLGLIKKHGLFILGGDVFCQDADGNLHCAYRDWFADGKSKASDNSCELSWQIAEKNIKSILQDVSGHQYLISMILSS